MGVPRTVINEDTYIEGLLPEQMLMDKVRGVGLGYKDTAKTQRAN